MTVVRPNLIVQRLVVRAGPSVVYDQHFHEGLNIIRGSNSSGKSTILDFIFYALGGDVVVWKTAASQCTDVSAEVKINDTVITLQRKVTSAVRTPMAIYWGPLEESEKHHFENWAEYPYAARGESESFSKVLFRVLGYPEVKSDQENNLTMHQVLRLIYIDQISRTTSLMREEDWDTPLTRRTIADLLFGAYDDTLYADEVNLRIRERELKDVSLQVIHTADILAAVDKDLDAPTLKKRFTELSVGLNKVNTEIERTLDETAVVRDTSATEMEKLRQQIAALRHRAAFLADKTEEIQLEIADSDAFLTNLRARLAAIEESIVTRDSLGDMPACPLCSVQLKQVDGEVRCEFSGKAIPGDFGRANMLKMREELRYQIKESESLQRDRRQELQQTGEERSGVAIEIEQQSRTFRQKMNAVKTARDNRLDELYQQKGRLEAKIESVSKLGKYLDVLTTLRKRETQLKGFVAEIAETIKEKRRKQAGRWEQSLAEIQSNVVFILANDLKRQDEFSQVESLHLRFDKNTYLLNGKNNFSASSNAVLKNAIHFGIHFASAEDPEFRYPRFILCDNVEDGGMEPDRSRNFQKIVASLSEKSTRPFQVILSTSMIHPDLDNDAVCVGPAYSKENKTLKLPSELQRAAVAAEPVDEASPGTNDGATVQLLEEKPSESSSDETKARE